MIGSKSLALYKNRPVLVVESGEKLEIRLKDGSSLKVREKDIEALHPGPLSAIPAAATGGDFETARAMAGPGRLSYAELADLVFGQSGPAEILACWEAGNDGSLFRLSDGGLIALSDEEAAKEAEKRNKKGAEAALRMAFIDKAKKARGHRAAAPESAAPEGGGLAGGGQVSIARAPVAPVFGPEDQRFLAEIESFALGRAQKCRLAGEIGFQETVEAAHAFLLATGCWDETVNPYPSRSGCASSAPKIALEADRPVPAGSPAARADLRGIAQWAIDNAWSNDPDDAIGFQDGFVYVSVADPAASILPGSALDTEAMGRGSTLYTPEGIVPLLPEEAMPRYGLGLSEESPALTFKIALDDTAAISTVEVMASTLRVRRTNYAAADELIAEGRAPDLSALAETAAKRRARRQAAGAVSIDIPEVRIWLSGGQIHIDPVPETKASGIVQEIMLLAGEAAARWAFERRLPFPFYGQEAPADPAEGAASEGLAAEFAKRRTMRGGILGPTPTAHHGLGLPFYAQVTSPLRRYQDLLGHIQIRALLEGRTPLDSDEMARRCAAAQAAQTGVRQAERASELHWTLAYLYRNPGWTGKGIIVGQINPYTYQVFLPGLGLETKLKLGNGRTMNEELDLRLVRVDLSTLESSFDEVEG